MLVLSRKLEQEVLILPGEGVDPKMSVAELFSHGPIRIKLVEILRGKQVVRLGIEAPRTIAIVRGELALR